MTTEPPGSAPAVRLHAGERRVLGVLIEKGLTTPEYYPMTVNGLIAGCNQKNNRDPLTDLGEVEVSESLAALASKGLVLSIIGDSGRAMRWRQELTRKWELDVVALAIFGELLLRGAQSEGDLRGRASRMRPIETLEALREQLARLKTATPARPALVTRLSPEGAARGVLWSNAFDPRDHAAQTLSTLSETTTAQAEAPARQSAAPAEPRADLATRVAALERRMTELEARVGVSRGGGSPAGS